MGMSSLLWSVASHFVPLRHDFPLDSEPVEECPQAQSLFFSKLPVDIRLLIYELLLVDRKRTIHISRNDHHLIHCRCLEVDLLIPISQHLCWHAGQSDRSYIYTKTLKDIRRADRFLPILLTCRTSYSEAAYLLYKTNKFSFPGAGTLLSFSQSIRPENWNIIQHLTLVSASTTATFDRRTRVAPFSPNWLPSRQIFDKVTLESLCTSEEQELTRWANIPRILNKMRGLQSLTVQFLHVAYSGAGERLPVGLDFYMGILRPLNSVRVRQYILQCDAPIPATVLAALGPLSFELVQIPPIPRAMTLIGATTTMTPDRMDKFRDFHEIKRG